MAPTHTADDLVAHAVRSMTEAGLDPAARPEPVPFRVGGFEAFVKQMTACERARLYGWALAVGIEHPDRLAVVAALTICDSDGNLLFSPTDLAELRDRLDSATIHAVAGWACSTNRW